LLDRADAHQSLAHGTHAAQPPEVGDRVLAKEHQPFGPAPLEHQRGVMQNHPPALVPARSAPPGGGLAAPDRIDGLAHQPGVADQRPPDHHPIAPGLAHHRQRIGGGADIAIADGIQALYFTYAGIGNASLASFTLE
jgi:hypothetical protein